MPDLGVDVPLLEPRILPGEVADDAHEVFLFEVTVAVGPADDRKHPVDLLLPLEGHPEDVLGKDVEAVLRYVDPVHEPILPLLEHHRALHELVTVEDDDPPFHHLAEAVPGPPDPLEERCHGLRGPDLEDEVDVGHIDTEFKRRRRRHRLHLPGLEFLLDGKPPFRPHRAVVAPRVLFGVILRVAGPEVMEDPLGAVPGVREYERVLVLPDEAVDRCVEMPREVFGGGVGKVGDRADEGEIELPGKPGIDDRDLAPDADQEPADLVEGFDRRRAPYPGKPTAGLLHQVFEALKAHREVDAAFRTREGVDLVDDDPPNRPEALAELR
ncbi:hypothetical protein DSECCO2_580920 [anaerobic digester metagenome]